ncbi:sodium:proton antiporter [Mycetocola lacteus]|uniref:Sodium:proton antiporter n=1 Tax=Mycetocola lacteus TaxID=76637 RepID=A0A3L7AW53_9MICO|nr:MULTISPECIES: monovalent cation/H+ antiporter complex subunit F [Mycetocola]MCS4277803.1 multicomponent Na+:H+ antiporter subunit F [Mycetocola sp. BIGb0189]RLP83758.1 sodium:proton antiporter [Mycetocola lacteus]
MTIILGIIIAMFGASALCAVYRIVRGPSLLDRVIASDVLVATAMCAMGAEMAINRHTNTLPVMLVLAMFAIVGSVSVARFMSNQAEA